MWNVDDWKEKDTPFLKDKKRNWKLKILHEVSHLLCVIFKRANPPTQKNFPNDASLQYSYAL